MIRWLAPVCESIAPQGPMLALLERAIADNPGNVALRVKYADLKLDSFDFAAAAGSLEAARALGSRDELTALRLARCYNGLGRFEDVLELFKDDPRARFDRANALIELGRAAEAEAELRRVLDETPDHRHAAWKLFKLLRANGRTGEVLRHCEALSASGVGHSQLFYDWGRSLALEGNLDRARALLFDRRRVAAMTLDPPGGFADIAAFNDALAEDLLANPAAVHSFPAGEANRGSSRVHNLFSGGGGERLIGPLIAELQRKVEDYVSQLRPAGAFDPWVAGQPDAARLRAWGLIQKGDAYEEWHLHRGGWLSGVYYVRVPAAVTEAGLGPGCIEYGPPVKLAEQFPDLAPTLRVAPREGMLLLSPSHYLHRTIPSGADEYRISFAFDVVPAA